MNTISARKPAVAVIIGSLSIGLFLIAWLYARPAFPQDNPFELPPVTGGETLTLDEDSAGWLLTNNSSEDLYIETIDVTWPQESGNLRQITFNGRIYKGEMAAPTASLDASILGKERLRMLPGGKDRTLQIKFDQENPAATQDLFLISVSFDDGTIVEIGEPPPDAGLPPYPGEAGKATLGGIDSDGDGVRDDVQREIVLLNDEDTDEQIRVQMEYAKSLLEDIRMGASVEPLPDIDQYESFAMNICMSDLFGPGGAEDRQSLIKIVVLNTDERQVAYNEYYNKKRPSKKFINAGTAGKIIKGGNACDF